MLYVGSSNWIDSKAAQPRLTTWIRLRNAPCYARRTGGNANTKPSASIAAVAIEFPPHQVGQREALSGLTGFGGPQFDRFGASAGVETRRIALPLSQYGQLSGFTESNDIFIETALELGERALLSAFDAAKVKPAEVDIVFSTTVTGLAVPTLEARLATRDRLAARRQAGAAVRTWLCRRGRRGSPHA